MTSVQAGATLPPYVYRCTDRSWLTGVISRHLAPKIEKQLPAAWSANTITWIGSGLVWFLLAGVILCPPEMRRPLAPLGTLLLWAYCLLDHVDGCRARVRGTSSAWGEFLDHGLDAWNGIIALTAIAVLSQHAISWRVLLIAVAAVSVSTAAVWLEQKVRGEFFLPAIGPVEGVLLAGVGIALWASPAAARAMSSVAPVPGLAITVANLAMLFAAALMLAPAVIAVFRTKAIALSLTMFTGLCAVILSARVSCIAILTVLALVAGEFSSRVIRNHLRGLPVPLPDFAAALLLIAARRDERIALAAVAWIACRVLNTWRTAAGRLRGHVR